MEVQDGEKCCFCIPRCKLNMWGYIKLPIMVLMLILVILHSVNTVAEPSIWNDHVFFIVFLSFFTFLLIMDICFTIVLVLGKHLKTAKRLHMYFIYCIVFMVTVVLMLLYCIGRSMYHIDQYMIYQGLSLLIKYFPQDHSLDGHMHNLSRLVLSDFVLGLLYFVIQICVIIATRNVVKKLKNDSSCSYINLNAGGGAKDDETDDNRF